MKQELTLAEKHLAAITLLLVESRTTEARAETKDEVLLRDAGFGIKEIADLLGKKENAVGMAISRSKKK